MIQPHTIPSTIYRHLLLPRQKDKDSRRQEFILNVLLSGLFVIGVLAAIISATVLMTHQNTSGLQPLVHDAVFLLCITTGKWLVWKGQIRLVSYTLLILLSIAATELMITWSFELPQMLLDYILVIVVAGILLGARTGLAFAGIISVIVIGGAYLQTVQVLHPNVAWRQHQPLFFDAAGFALVFFVTGIVSWLSNREIDRSLQRARQSELALLRERDSLEVKVAERTRELEQSQLIRIMELERFAAFGRIHAALIHDVSNPLMTATLHLQRLKVPGRQVEQINQSLVQIGQQLASARRQLRGGGLLSTFSVSGELRQAADIVQPLAQRHRVKLRLPTDKRLRLHGDAVKFSQVVCNLLVNAVESYPLEGSDTQRVVGLTVTPLKRGIKLTVHDHGGGITADEMKRIFEPFYSKKPVPEQHVGMGIGLDIVKRFVEQDFKGSLRVSSSPRAGTRFIVTLYSAEKADHG